MKYATGMLLALTCSTALAVQPRQRTLTFEDRVKAQEAIERVYYAHQIGSVVAFESAVPRSVLESKVRTYLAQTEALASFWRISVTDEMLQGELERMARATRMPERLLELYAALGDDAFLIKECFARARLVDRLARDSFALDPTLHMEARRRAEALLGRIKSGELSPMAHVPERSVAEFAAGGSRWDPLRRRTSLSLTELRDRRAEYPGAIGQVSRLEEVSDRFLFSVVLSESPRAFRVARYAVPKVSWDTWWKHERPAMRPASVAAVASGDGPVPVPSNAPIGSTTCPPEDSWQSTTLIDAPSARFIHTAVWTGNEMIVWGGWDESLELATGGRYDPAADTWTPTATDGAPSARDSHTAVWTGNEMIVWGGWNGGAEVRTGGRYDPATDTWTQTSTIAAPSEREAHTAVWTGNTMIVWGGYSTANAVFFPSAGGRYDPLTDSWTPTSAVGAPIGRYVHTAVWSGSVMVIWGGDYYDGLDHFQNTGGRYNPTTDVWTPTSAAASPGARGAHTALWTGSRMVIWGGDFYDGADHFLNTGGRYDPTTDSWTPTSTQSAPHARDFHTAAWTGNRMVVWGGFYHGNFDEILDTGGRYDPITDTWLPTSPFSAPRAGHTAVSTGSLMVVWGGAYASPLNDGGRYALSTSDGDGDGYSACAGDCDDSNAAIRPGADDVCNGIDDDCDNAIDDLADRFCTDDDNPCTTEVCHGVPECDHVNNLLLCEDGDACTKGDTCSNGSCISGSPTFCDDSNLCTDDSCDSIDGCVHTDTSGSCADGNVCTADACDPASGCSTIHKPVNIDTETFSADRVDGRDLVILASAWNSCAPEVRYNAAADLHPHSFPPGACVDEADFHLFMGAFGQSCP